MGSSLALNHLLYTIVWTACNMAPSPQSIQRPRKRTRSLAMSRLRLEWAISGWKLKEIDSAETEKHGTLIPDWPPSSLKLLDMRKVNIEKRGGQTPEWLLRDFTVRHDGKLPRCRFREWSLQLRGVATGAALYDYDGPCPDLEAELRGLCTHESNMAVREAPLCLVLN